MFGKNWISAMASQKKFTVHDPVQFLHRGKLVVGHIGKKTPKEAVVLSSDGRDFRVPWASIQRDKNGRRKRVTLRSELFKTQFRPEDRVMFETSSGVMRGTIARLGPKRAVVMTDQDQEYRVGYSWLRPLGASRGKEDLQRLAEIRMIAERMMTRHGLKGWSFQFDDASRRAGLCLFSTRVIALSRQFCVQAPNKEVADTILHEIAHALVGPKHNHDAVWKAAARSIGCTAERCHDVDFAPPRYIISCLFCRWVGTRNVRRRHGVCKTCKTPVRYETYTKKAWDIKSRLGYTP